MTKTEYLRYRENKSANILYEYYKENYKGGSSFLDPNSFVEHMRLWPFANIAFENAIAHYDDKFQVTKVFDENGNLIKII